VTLAYGFVEAKIVSGPVPKGSHRQHETQYHLHFGSLVDDANWDVAVNVGTNDADNLLKFKLVYDFRHVIAQTLGGAASGSNVLTGQSSLPALDFLRSDILANTGKWRDSDVMDGTDLPEPAASLKRLLERARGSGIAWFGFER
jgi:hypothetical protein